MCVFYSINSFLIVILKNTICSVPASFIIIIIVGINYIIKVQSPQNFFVFESSWAFSVFALYLASELCILNPEVEDGWKE